jgi:hypothetical protein
VSRVVHGRRPIVPPPPDPKRWPQPCSQCGQHVETRPYGVGGALVCGPCGTGTPEAEAEAIRRFKAAMAGPEPRVLTDLGPQPLPTNLTGPGRN